MAHLTTALYFAFVSPLSSIFFVFSSPPFVRAYTAANFKLSATAAAGNATTTATVSRARADMLLYEMRNWLVAPG
jgi:hypothetical protein